MKGERQESWVPAGQSEDYIICSSPTSWRELARVTNISSEEDQENLSVIYNIYCFPEREGEVGVESDSSRAFCLLVTFMVGNVGLYHLGTFLTIF